VHRLQTSYFGLSRNFSILPGQYEDIFTEIYGPKKIFFGDILYCSPEYLRTFRGGYLISAVWKHDIIL